MEARNALGYFLCKFIKSNPKDKDLRNWLIIPRYQDIPNHSRRAVYVIVIKNKTSPLLVFKFSLKVPVEFLWCCRDFNDSWMGFNGFPVSGLQGYLGAPVFPE